METRTVTAAANSRDLQENPVYTVQHTAFYQFVDFVTKIFYRKLELKAYRHQEDRNNLI